MLHKLTMWHRFLSCVVDGSGWRQWVVLWLAGALCALSLPPFYGWPLAVVGIGALFVTVQSAGTIRQACWRGWWWGFGFFVVGLYWIVISMTIDLARFGWMIPFVLIGFNGGLALFYGLGAGLFAWLSRLLRGRQKDWLGWLLFAACFTASEWSRGHILTGFPWNLPGYVWGASEWTVQAASFLSIYHLTFLAFAFGAAVAVAMNKEGRGRAYPVILSMVGVLAMVGFGVNRMPQQMELPQPEAGLTVRLVQPNVQQGLKWEPEHARTAVDRLQALSQSEGWEAVDMFIWPETAFPYLWKDGHRWSHRLTEWLLPHQRLVTGLVVAASDPQKGYYNSLLVLDASGQVVGRYDKQHLVPFGEYVPFRDVLPIAKLTAGGQDFLSGKQNRGQGLPFTPMICYEVIFPSYAQGAGEWLLNLTNDAWFGYSSGPYQHEQMARFRAVEQGKSMVRVANTGVSVAFDPYGRVIRRLPLNQSGVLDVTFPNTHH